MGKRQHRAAKEKNSDLPLHSRPTTSTPEHKRRERRDPVPATGSDSEPDPSPPSSPASSVRRLIETYSKPRLASILAEAAASDPALRARLVAVADASPSHRRLFVHGLPPRADAAALAEAFSRFGPLAECHVVADRAAAGERRCKGYGFVSFASRAAARRALRDAPRVLVAGRPVSAQLASAGPDSPSGGGGSGGGAGRRVYVTNVPPDAAPERLRAFFARFGELEGGPFGFDADTGRSLGYALFVYRAAAGAATAVAEPYRVFEGRTLHCQLANEPARKAKAQPAPPAAGDAPALQPVLDAIAAAGVGDLASYARDPARAAALLGQNPALAAAALSSALATAAQSPAVAAAVATSPAAASAPMPVGVAAGRPVTTAAAVVPSPVKFGVGPSSGGAGLLGPYKPPSASAAATAAPARGGSTSTAGSH
jgi:heterogeneous nuclear ribonucleoprotein A1/A3